MARAKKGGKKSRKRAGTGSQAKLPRHGSFILLDKAEKLAVLQEMDALAEMAKGSELELKILAVRKTLFNSTFSGHSHFWK